MADIEQAADDGQTHPPKAGSSPIAVMQELSAQFMRTSGPAYHPIFDKFDSEHVTQFLSQAHAADEAERNVRRSNRWFHATYTGLGVGVFLFVTVWLLPEQSALYAEIVKGMGLFAGGLAGGYGLKAYQDRKSQGR